MSTFDVSLFGEEFFFVFLVENKQLVLLPVGFVSIFPLKTLLFADKDLFPALFYFRISRGLAPVAAFLLEIWDYPEKLKKVVNQTNKFKLENLVV